MEPNQASSARIDSGPPRWQIPRLDGRGSPLVGVSTAVAAELGVSPVAVRYGFATLALQGGWGVLLYGLCWVAISLAPGRRANLYEPQPKADSPRSRYLALIMIVAGLMALGDVLGFGLWNSYLVPLAMLVLAFILAWRHRSGESGVWTSWRMIVAMLLVVGAVPFFVFTISGGNAVYTGASLAILVPILAVALPGMTRVALDLDDERAERVRADERARVAAHLHDSVLQTLTLIQKNAGDSARTAALARQQERELRAWLYGTEAPDATTRMEPALAEVANAIESRHQLLVNVVVVGDDRPIEPEVLSELCAAVQEALTNAAKHAEVDSVDVYAEISADGVELFIRDDGKGFEVEMVGADRRGVAQSIMARMQRLGGSAVIDSAPGEGTEVELRLPFSQTNGGKRNESR